MSARREELQRRLEAVQARIAEACARAGREPSEVRLLPVTKTFPADDVAALIDIGLREFAENRDHEASTKVLEVAKLRPEAEVRWHMVGRLQRNKARSVVSWADEVQSLDSVRLADALAHAVATARAQGERTGPLDVQVQASIDGDPERGGCPLGDLLRLVDHITRTGELSIMGLMAIAPRDVGPDEAFAALHEAYVGLQADFPQLTELSAGMSGDLEQAVAHGSTRVRVGTALLGHRELA